MNSKTASFISRNLAKASRDSNRIPTLWLYVPEPLREAFLKAFWPHFEAQYGEGFLLELSFCEQGLCGGLSGSGVCALPPNWLVKMLVFRTNWLKVAA